MNAYTSQEELALLPANRMSYARSDASPVTAPLSSPRVGLFARVAAYVRNQAARREMEALSDYELRDIGLSRCDLDRVFDNGFSR